MPPSTPAKKSKRRRSPFTVSAAASLIGGMNRQSAHTILKKPGGNRVIAERLLAAAVVFDANARKAENLAEEPADPFLLELYQNAAVDFANRATKARSLAVVFLQEDAQ